MLQLQGQVGSICWLTTEVRQADCDQNGMWFGNGICIIPGTVLLQMKHCASSNCRLFMGPGKLLSSGLGENSYSSLKLVFFRFPRSIARDCLKWSCLELDSALVVGILCSNLLRCPQNNCRVQNRVAMRAVQPLHEYGLLGWYHPKASTITQECHTGLCLYLPGLNIHRRN